MVPLSGNKVHILKETRIWCLRVLCQTREKRFDLVSICKLIPRASSFISHLTFLNLHSSRKSAEFNLQNRSSGGRLIKIQKLVSFREQIQIPPSASTDTLLGVPAARSHFLLFEYCARENALHRSQRIFLAPEFRVAQIVFSSDTLRSEPV